MGLRSMILLAILLSGIAVAGETKIEFVYFGGAGCGLCRNQDLRAKMAPAIEAIEQESKRRGWSFEEIAVSVDLNPEHGRTFLRTFCPEFDTHICTGEGFKTDLFQELVMRAPAQQEGANIQFEGIPYLVLTKNSETQIVLARYVSSTILPFLNWVTVADPAKREMVFACLFDQQCPGFHPE